MNIKEKFYSRLETFAEGGPLNTIAESTPEELEKEAKKRKIKTAFYAGAAIVGVLVASKTEGFVDVAAKVEVVGSGLMVWNHGSHALLYGHQDEESQNRIAEHRKQNTQDE
jgi:hypothetical protein